MQENTVAPQHNLAALGDTTGTEPAARTISTGAQADPGASIFGDSVSVRALAFGCYVASLAGLLVSGGLLSIAALLVAFIQRPSTRGTLYESHFDWIVNSGLIALVLGVALSILSVLLFSVLGGLAILLTPAFIALAAWFIYRMVKGLLRLNADRSMD